MDRDLRNGDKIELDANGIITWNLIKMTHGVGDGAAQNKCTQLYELTEKNNFHLCSHTVLLWLVSWYPRFTLLHWS